MIRAARSGPETRAGIDEGSERPSRLSAALSTSSTVISSRQKGLPEGAGGHSRKKFCRHGEHG